MTDSFLSPPASSGNNDLSIDGLLRDLSSLDALGSPRTSFMLCDPRPESPASAAAMRRRSSLSGVCLSPIPRLSFTGIAGTEFLTGPASTAAMASSTAMLSMPNSDARRRLSSSGTESAGRGVRRPSGFKLGGLLPSAEKSREPLSPLSPGLLMCAGLLRRASATRNVDGTSARRRSSDFGLDFETSVFPRRASGSFFDFVGVPTDTACKDNSKTIRHQSTPSTLHRISRMSLVEVSETIADAAADSATGDIATAISFSTQSPLEEGFFGSTITSVTGIPSAAMATIKEEDGSLNPEDTSIVPSPLETVDAGGSTPRSWREHGRQFSATRSVSAPATQKKLVSASQGPSRSMSASESESQSNNNRKRKPKPYQSCPHCEKLFLCASKLERHLRTHTGVKPYKCQCGQTFSQKSSLKVHSRRHALEAVDNGIVVENDLINGFPVAGLLADAKRAKNNAANRTAARKHRSRSAGTASISPGVSPSRSPVSSSPKLHRASMSRASKSRRSLANPLLSPPSPWIKATAGKTSPDIHRHNAIYAQTTKTISDATTHTASVPLDSSTVLGGVELDFSLLPSP